MCRINVTERKASHVLTKTLKIPFLSFLQYCYSYILHGIWVYYRLRRKERISWLIAGQKVGILISPRAKDGVCPQSKRQSVRQSIRGGGPGNPPSFSLLAENFKLLCKFPAATVSDVFGVPKWRVWREQKRQANAIIQVAAAISCLISIINTRHRQRATGNWKPASRAKSIQTRPGTRRSHKARGADTSNN